MARRPGHEDCRSCSSCGLGWCPDCDDKGQTCRCGFDNETDFLTADEVRRWIFYSRWDERRRRVTQRIARARGDRGASTTEYGLVVGMIAAVAVFVGGTQLAVSEAWTEFHERIAQVQVEQADQVNQP